MVPPQMLFIGLNVKLEEFTENLDFWLILGEKAANLEKLRLHLTWQKGPGGGAALPTPELAAVPNTESALLPPASYSFSL